MADPVDASQTYEQLWFAGSTPDLLEFTARRAGLSAAELAELVRIDQRERSRRGRPMRAEDYLAALPRLAADTELALDVVYHEYLLREQRDDRPTVTEYAARFPQYAAMLADQIGLHGALASAPAAMEPASTLIGETPSSAGRAGPRFGDLPAQFGRYRILELLGRGGMGDVYLATDEVLGRQVAIKFPRFGDGVGNETLARFRREARIAAGFHHPHLCPIYDFGELDGVWFLTMPYVVGRTLSALVVERRRLPEAEALQLVARVAAAVAVAHRAGVVHRDLKSANIIVKDDGQPMVMDFGLARRNEGLDPSLTGSGALVGTPAYMAPEQVGAAPDDVGPASDIYSLGVVLYEALVGHPPFQGSAHQVLRQVLIDDPPPLSQSAQGISKATDALCAKALAKDPDQRFASMEEFSRALEQVAQTSDHLHETVRASNLRPVGTAVRNVSRSKVLIAMALVISLVVGGIAIWRRSGGPSNWLGSDVADTLPVGSRWVGRFQFAGMNYEGSVEVTISERSGEGFLGTYRTENGDYVWRIHGTLRDENINWEFTDVIREKEPRSLVGQAYVEGVCRESQMDIAFRHPAYGSEAAMILQRIH